MKRILLIMLSVFLLASSSFTMNADAAEQDYKKQAILAFEMLDYLDLAVPHTTASHDRKLLILRLALYRIQKNPQNPSQLKLFCRGHLYNDEITSEGPKELQEISLIKQQISDFYLEQKFDEQETLRFAKRFDDLLEELNNFCHCRFSSEEPKEYQKLTITEQQLLDYFLEHNFDEQETLLFTKYFDDLFHRTLEAPHSRFRAMKNLIKEQFGDLD